MGAPLRQVMLHSFVHAANMDSQTYQVPGYGVLKGSVKTGGGGGHAKVGGKNDGEKRLYKDPKRGSADWR